MTRTIDVGGPVDLVRTLGSLSHRDPTMRFARGEVWRATRTPGGPATTRLRQLSPSTIVADAWGPGQDWALEHAPHLVGAHDDVAAFNADAHTRRHPLLRDLARRFAGLRLPTTHTVADQLVPVVIEQKVQTGEAQAAYRRLLVATRELAPGPVRLHLPPDPRRLARLPYWTLHRCGIEKRRADTIRHVALVAHRLDEAVTIGHDETYRRMRAIPGVGAWSAGEVGMRAMGDADAVPVGDYHLPHLVSFALAGEPRGDDARMLELLEPFRPHRARVVRLLVLGGLRAPRFGPRMPASPLATGAAY